MGKAFKKRVILLLILFVATFLRLWKLEAVPVSLFSDELDVGYQAYSIIHTGKDYFGNPWPVHFQSFADTRTPLYIYASVPTVSAFGITAWGVRLPAAFFGILGVWAIYLLAKQIFNDEKTAIIASGVLALSPWHIQYSRAGFEVTMLLTFLLFGLYFFFRSLGNGKWLWLSTTFLVSCLWIYSTAKLFVPLLLVALFFLFRKQIVKMGRVNLFKTVLAGLIVGVPIVLSTFLGGGGLRFGYLSVFTDPTTHTEVSYSRLTDAAVEGASRNIFEKADSWFIHNKYTQWTARIVENYFKSYSTEFLFLKGDLNLRHSIEGVGQFYKVEAFALILGLISLTVFFKDKKLKALIFFWLTIGVLPSAITRDGGAHATRLILILPPLIFLISYGLTRGVGIFSPRLRRLALSGYMALFIFNFWSYQHSFWVHNPWYSERSWHAGYKEVVELVKKYESGFEKIIISNADQPPSIFFASYYPVPPEKWQEGLDEDHVQGFGNTSHLGKYYFGQVGEEGLLGLGEIIEEGTLYIAAQREIEGNLLESPQKVPKGLKLIDKVIYPSGEPAFWAFAKDTK